MQGKRYYKNLDFSAPVATHKSVKYSSMRDLAKKCLVAMARINQSEQGTIFNPYDLSSSSMPDGRTLIQTIYEDGYVMYNDGWFIVEVDNTWGENEAMIYVDVTGVALRECPEYKNMRYIRDEYTEEFAEEEL